MVDVLGGLGDDPRALVHPGEFVASKVAPGIRLASAAAGTLTGTSAPEGAEGVFQQLGGVPQAVEAVARPIATGQLPTVGEALRDVVRLDGPVPVKCAPQRDHHRGRA